MAIGIGIDFGTTNSVLAAAFDDGTIRTAKYEWPSGVSETFRTVLCFWQEEGRTVSAAGQDAITEYLKDTEESRFIQSIKTYLGSATFTETRFFNARFELEDLIALFLRKMWERAAPDLGLDLDPSGYTVLSGRPVEFAGNNPDENLAIKRLEESYRRAGFKNISFAYEPEGAAFWYAQSLQSDTTVLVADFGGGTSDFSIVHCTKPDDGAPPHITPVAHSGVGIAGDTLDYRIIDHVISPLLGKGSTYQSFGKILDMPISYYRSFASWHLLSMLKTPRTLREIEEIARTSSAPEKLRALHTFIAQEMGYLLYQSVGKAKAALSSDDKTQFSFAAADIRLERTITRHEFEVWINPDIDRIKTAIADVLKKAAMTPDKIDRVFMTGGTSFVPAVRSMIAQYFGEDRMASGGEFTSVGAGLALAARVRA